MSYSTPMSYMAPTSYQHSGLVYTGQPHYPYSAALQSPLAWPPILSPSVNANIRPAPFSTDVLSWSLQANQTNGPHPPVNYGARPSQAATSDQPSNTPAPQQPFTSGVNSKASVQTEISQFEEPGASCEDLDWDLGNESANFHKLKSSFLLHGPAKINPLALEGTDVWLLAPSGTCPVESTVPARPNFAVEQQTSMGLDLEMGDGLGLALQEMRLDLTIRDATQ
ncbi:uncharacterized protein PGTG_22228 [Puccinia graminis f. sp. tritici CRL 75-36-700-3]|uniref:Uncharacterized protein n=1 Tax=Puccinia graminis f. sp. tritici (strain CRL 75-36-700-3 / race SCCL) TaxID=418459 RepID=H6QTV6_PUCGT|nr:uncharacterized protein PGTG_22228 [Puccinia graminis f. sp. tritici CRL 75-36-700-3]EHS64370.1 hypothetical protein PGTG_22228 [Puccinia graminis f. sp. tritici CRL 75-36-700-3]